MYVVDIKFAQPIRIIWTRDKPGIATRFGMVIMVIMVIIYQNKLEESLLFKMSVRM